MSLDGILQRFGIKFFDDFVENSFARLVAINADEQTELLVMLQDWHSLGTKFFKARAEDFNVFVVGAIAAIVQSFGGFESGFCVGLGNI